MCTGYTQRTCKESFEPSEARRRHILKSYSQKVLTLPSSSGSHFSSLVQTGAREKSRDNRNLLQICRLGTKISSTHFHPTAVSSMLSHISNFKTTKAQLEPSPERLFTQSRKLQNLA